MERGFPSLAQDLIVSASRQAVTRLHPAAAGPTVFAATRSPLRHAHGLRRHAVRRSRQRLRARALLRPRRWTRLPFLLPRRLPGSARRWGRWPPAPADYCRRRDYQRRGLICKFSIYPLIWIAINSRDPK
jgi:hypothetical protein